MATTGVGWLDELMDEYPTNRTEKAIARLGRVFKDVPDRVMAAAVDKYMAEQKFFPKVSDLTNYVTWAQRDMPYEASAQIIDEQILRWEQDRGMFPDDDRLGTDYLKWDEQGQDAD